MARSPLLNCAAVLGLVLSAWVAPSRADGQPDVTIDQLRRGAQELLATDPALPPRRVLLTSSAVAGRVNAESHGLIDFPFNDVATALIDPWHWCAVLMLHINNKGCRITAAAGAPHIVLKVARRYDQPADQAYELDFAYEVIESGPASMVTRLHATNGPLGTSDYDLRLDAAPLSEGRTALRLSYSFRQAALTNVALNIYLATVGHGRVGFTVTGHKKNGEHAYVDGVRGMVERNLMLYFLAVEAAASEPEGTYPDAVERRLRRWFNATEDYPRQLHEVDLETYLALKRR